MSVRKQVYDQVEVELFAKHSKSGVLTIERAKEILGWESENESDVLFEKDYLFRDSAQPATKVRLTNNLTNRPFRMSLAKRWCSEILRKKWSLNGESLVVDRLGFVQDGQHRLVGLVLAEQERKKNSEKWKHYGWKGPVSIEAVLVTGISEKDEVVDTINLGQKRSLGDVIFRNQEFGEMKAAEQQKLSNVLANATRLAWLRVGGKTVSDAPHFPHSEALDFMEAHPRLQEAVTFIFNEEGGSGAEGKRISSYVSLGYAAALLYLMATAKTEKEDWVTDGADGLNYELWDKACEFWTMFAAGAGLEANNPILSLRKLLVNMGASASAGRDEIVSCIVKAWNAWVDEEEATPGDLKIKKTKNEAGKLVAAEYPRIGGLDTEEIPGDDEEVEGEDGDKEENEEEAPAPKAKKKKAAPKKAAAKKVKEKEAEAKPTKKAAKTKGGFKVGEWIWVKDDEGDDHWKAKIKEIEGNNVVVIAEADDKEYALELSDLSVNKPE